MQSPPSGPAAPVLPPSVIVADRYRIIRALSIPGASAAFASYEALDLQRGAAEQPSDAATPSARSPSELPYVTLRVLVDRSIGPGSAAERVQLAQLEASLLRVCHPAVAQTFELGLSSELGLFLAREPAERDGQTLRELLAARGGPLPEAEAIKLCAQIGEALEAAHQQGACHLSLSPSCIFVYPDGPEVRIKVADFGLLPPAWAAQLGEAGYLAPEQVSGQVSGQGGGSPDAHTCDRRTDQFALAVILYEMLAGQPAFIAAADEDRQIILSRVRNEDPLPLAQSRPVEQALARALSRSRGVRFPSVRDFVQALGADVSGWSSRPAAGPPAVAAPPHRPPRLLLPMIAGAVFSLVGLSAIGGLQRLTGKPVQGLFPTLWPWTARTTERRAPVPPVHDELPESAGSAKVDSSVRSDSSVRAASSGGAGDAGDFSARLDAGLLAAAPLPPAMLVDGGDLVDGDDGRLAAVRPRGAEDLRPALLAHDDETTRNPMRRVPPGTQVGGASSIAGPGTGPGAGPLALAFAGPEADALTKEQRSELTRCVKMISPRYPFFIALQNINGVFYVDPNRTSAELSGNQDFRDCLKLSVKGKIVPKVLTITKMIKGKAAP